MSRPFGRRAGALAVAGLAAVALVACSPPTDSDSGDSGEDGASSAASATSAEDLGGMDALVDAATEEGALNVIALPPDWANYGEVIKAFQAKYPDIEVTSDQPDASSADEISTAERLKGQSGAPDVFDLGASVALVNTDMFAPYQVSTWEDIPEEFKDPDGTWVNDYGGYMSIGYDSDKVPAPTSVQDLLKSDYEGKVALNGNPTEAGAAFAGVQMVSIAEGGSAGDLAKGVDFFKRLKEAGNFLPVDPTPATVQSGQTPVVIDWDYLNAGLSSQVPSWKVVVPDDAVVAGYYYQAVNADAPHPAAARLWEEFLYSDEGQNLWLKGGARPVRFDAMHSAGTLDEDAAAALPEVTGTPVVPTQEDADSGSAYLTKNWANAVG
ncbi:extracellular solute-binding protein [Phycicoccus endophyticus]|uniref:Extracellular solute-binding protein n=1 Tax=Phycicoccus endophyticus TaxID=1690220 RepID=A0A7G9R2X8_9MICO|nr:extracellular solute-binding protein [Phycicoccus endophyticus]NHI20243.1 extracellular solute-binding protein [Phycicoccus endophyticus]QNN49953.1 extracellular solute-binding protein [Phycicoccus endophyticus]GGL29315.1 ABC transporter substrate-binding protein [Phycicoccus endophyticus]